LRGALQKAPIHTHGERGGNFTAKAQTRSERPKTKFLLTPFKHRFASKKRPLLPDTSY
jgi:hypothetical protein